MASIGALAGAGIGLFMGIIVVWEFRKNKKSEGKKYNPNRIIIGLPALWFGGFFANTYVGAIIENNLEEILLPYLSFSLGICVIIIIFPLIFLIWDTANLFKSGGKAKNG